MSDNYLAPVPVRSMALQPARVIAAKSTVFGILACVRSCSILDRLHTSAPCRAGCGLHAFLALERWRISFTEAPTIHLFHKSPYHSHVSGIP